MIKALEFNGQMYIPKEPIHITDAWYVVKNQNVPNARALAAVINAKKTYKCEFDKDIESKIADMTSSLLVTRTTS
jgi:hypothetical protein